MERPSIVVDEHLVFLDDLREEGSVNMFGAAPELITKFPLSKPEAKEVLKYWMKTFGQEDR